MNPIKGDEEMSFETVVALNGDYKLYYLHDKRLKSSDPIQLPNY